MSSSPRNSIDLSRFKEEIASNINVTRWSPKVEILLKEIQTDCQQQYAAHLLKIRKFKIINYILTSMTILFSLASSILAQIDSYDARFALKILAPCTASVTSICAYASIESRIEREKATSYQYFTLLQLIKAEMSQAEEDRTDINKFLRYIITSFTDIFNSSDYILLTDIVVMK